MPEASEARAVGRDAESLIAQNVRQNAAAYRDCFLEADPFRHVLIDGFFEPAFAEELLAAFPAFNPELAKNEIYGGVWGKAVNTRIREIAPAYRQLFELIGSRAFLGLIEEITGIADLIFDPELFGGGTHENLHGQDLDPHVDFNYDQTQKLHRRLNLIVYLNKGWRMEWGGALELHSNPRKPSENRVQAFNPIFNRAVLFETNEYSWHGFPRIELPPEERRRSRKSISIYLYTRERPAEEVAAMHSTFYVQRPLPGWVRPGHVLSEEDCKYLAHAADRRDKWVEFYQNLELTKSREIAEQVAFVRELLSRVRAPLTGYAMQEGGSSGVYADGWTGTHIALKIRPQRPVTALRLRGWRPDHAPATARVRVRMDGREAAQATAGHGVFEIDAACERPLTDPFTLEVECDPGFRPAGDHREVAFVLMEIRAEHG